MAIHLLGRVLPQITRTVQRAVRDYVGEYALHRLDGEEWRISRSRERRDGSFSIILCAENLLRISPDSFRSSDSNIPVVQGLYPREESSREEHIDSGGGGGCTDSGRRTNTERTDLSY
jgi:hypothetical protein